jgi:hypothetical protein
VDELNERAKRPPVDHHLRRTQRRDFRWQSAPWVVGIEGDAQQSQQRGQATTFNCAGATCHPAASAFGLDAPVAASMASWLGFGPTYFLNAMVGCACGRCAARRGTFGF